MNSGGGVELRDVPIATLEKGSVIVEMRVFRGVRNRSREAELEGTSRRLHSGTKYLALSHKQMIDDSPKELASFRITMCRAESAITAR